MNQILIVPRGCGKSVGNYFRWLTRIYLKRDISREDYLTMIAVASVELLHQDYDETCAWLEKMLESNSDEIFLY